MALRADQHLTHAFRSHEPRPTPCHGRNTTHACPGGCYDCFERVSQVNRLCWQRYTSCSPWYQLREKLNFILSHAEGRDATNRALVCRVN